MGLELLLLSALIFIFIVSFCGLLQKIKQSYERERIIAERIAHRHQQQSTSVSDGFINITYIENENSSSIFPEAPPPYTHAEPPPKYDEIMKDRDVSVTVNIPSRTPMNPIPNGRPIAVHSSPPPYTIPI